MDERAVHTVETKSEHLTDNNETFCCVPTALYRLVSLAVELTHLVVKWSAVRNQSEIETSLKMRGMSLFLFVKLVHSAETYSKPCKTSLQCTSIKRPAIYWDHAVSWGGEVWVSVSDIGRVGEK